MSANIEAGRRADELDSATRHASDRTTNRVRGLYMSGGPLAVYGTLLGAGNVVDLANRTEMVERVLNSDRSREAGWRTNSHDARRTATKAARAVVTRVHTVRDIAGVYAALKQTLAEEQSLLARARQQLRRIQAQEAELARRAEAARQAAAAAAAARPPRQPPTRQPPSRSASKSRRRRLRPPRLPGPASWSRTRRQ